MSVFLNIETKLDEPLAQTAMRSAITMWDKTGKDIGHGLSGAISKALGSFDTSAAQRELGALTAAVQKHRDAEDETARVMTRSQGAVETQTRRLSEVTAKYGAESSQAAASTAMLADAHARAARDGRTHADAMVASEDAANKMSTAHDNAATSVNRFGTVANAVGIGSIAVLGATMVETGKKAADFEQQMTKLSAAASVPADQLKTLSDGVLSMAGKVGYSTTELNDALFTVMKSGYNAADGLKVLQAAAQGANAEQAPLADVVNTLTTSLHDFNIPADQANRVMSQMVTMAGESKAPLADLAGALHTIEQPARNANISLADLWGTLAQITQSGTTADQASDWINNAMRSLTSTQGPARDAMQQLGINAQDVTDKLGDGPGGRGLAGTMQYLSDQALAHLSDASHINVGELKQNAQAAANATEMISHMSPEAAKASQALIDGTMTTRQYTMAIRGSNEEDGAKMKQFSALEGSVDGFSKKFANGADTLQTYNQIMNALTGTNSGAQIAFQVTGDNAKETNDRIAAIATTYTNADGSVKGFDETQTTLNAKMRDAKAAFGAAGIEIGETFVPVLKEVAEGAKWVGDELAKHPGVAHAATDAMIGLAGAWALWKLGTGVAAVVSGLGTVIEKTKLLMTAQDDTTAAATKTNAAMGSERVAAAETGATGVATAAEGEIAEEDAVATSATEADTALSAGGGAGLLRGGATALPAVGAAWQFGQNSDKWVRDHPDLYPGAGQVLDSRGKGMGAYSSSIQNEIDLAGHAGGGAISGSGPKGKDSVPTWMAPGEHVFTASDVDAMGGQGAVYAFRNALHREFGGSDLDAPDVLGGYGPDVQAAAQKVGTSYSQALRDDCSGMVGRVINEALGIAGSQLPTTQNMGQWLAERGFQPGIGGAGDMSVGWYNHGSGTEQGHAAMTLSNGMNAESGGSHGNFLIGRGAAGASNPEFDQHMFLPGQGGGGEAVFAAQEKVGKLEDRIKELQEQISEETVKTKQSEKDKLDDELKRTNEELDHAKDNLSRAQEGGSGSGRGGRGGKGSGGLQFGAKLPENFGLGKGIPGFFEWLTTFAADMAIGPIEGAMYGNALRAGQINPDGSPIGDDGSGADGGAGGSAGGYANLGDQGMPLPTSLAAQFSPTAAGSGGGASGSGGGSGGGTPGGTSSWYPGWKPQAASTPSGDPSGAYTDFQMTEAKAELSSPATRADSIAKAKNGTYSPGLSAAILALAGNDPAAPGGPPPAPAAPWVAPPVGFGPPSQETPSLSADTLAHLHGDVTGPGANVTTTHPPNVSGPSGQYPIWGAMHTGDGSAGTGSLSGDTLSRLHGDSGNLNYGPRGGFYNYWYPGSGLSPRAPGFATGGPSGTDTIPAWLSPGEFVMNKHATDGNLSALQMMNAGHFDVGSFTPLAPAPKPAPAPSAPKPQAKPQQAGQGQKAQPKPQPHIPPGGPQSPGPGNMPPPPGGSETHPSVATPGASTHQFGQDLPPSGGIGFGGGLIGAGESAASTAAGMAAGMGSMGGGGAAASGAMQLGFQLMNRTAGFAGQVGGIAAEGILKTFLPSDSSLSDFGNTLPGKLIAGVAGVRPGQPNSAGKTEKPLKPESGEEKGKGMGGGGDTVGHQYNGPITVKADNPDQFRQQMAREHSGAQAAYPMNLP